MTHIDSLGSVVRARRRHRRERGQVLAIFALMLVALLASAGLVGATRIEYVRRYS